MSRFTVRVELRNSNDADYNELHRLMEANGFSRTIRTDAGETYCMPSGEYSYTSLTRGKASVGNLANSVARQIRANPRILVTESDGRYILNLDRA